MIFYNYFLLRIYNTTPTSLEKERKHIYVTSTYISIRLNYWFRMWIFCQATSYEGDNHVFIQVFQQDTHILNHQLCLVSMTSTCISIRFNYWFGIWIFCQATSLEGDNLVFIEVSQQDTHILNHQLCLVFLTSTCVIIRINYWLRMWIFYQATLHEDDNNVFIQVSQKDTYILNHQLCLLTLSLSLFHCFCKFQSYYMGIYTDKTLNVMD